ncbi:MAG: T9SS type A sorting domain-containing protein [bacterium]
MCKRILMLIIVMAVSFQIIAQTGNEVLNKRFNNGNASYQNFIPGSRIENNMDIPEEMECYKNTINYGCSSLLKPQFENKFINTVSVVDNIIIKDESGQQTNKHTYSYNENGNIILYLNESWDGSQWVNSSQETNTYDSNGNIILYLSETWDGSQWLNDKRTHYAYDSNGNRTSYQSETWDGSQWVNSWWYSTIYDSNGNATLDLAKHWEENQWKNVRQYTYTYDSNGNITSVGEEWDGSQWVLTSRRTYEYNSNRDITLNFYELWDGSQWVNSSRRTYTYDTNWNLTFFLKETWDGSQWLNDSQETYTYDSNGNETLVFSEDWDGSQWVNNSRRTSTYDSNENRISYMEENWDVSKWVNVWRFTYTYDSNRNMISSLTEAWDGSQWINSIGVIWFEDFFGNYIQVTGCEINIYYKEITTEIKENDANIPVYSLSQNYPNPFNPSTVITWQLAVGSNVTLKIYDVLGREIATLVDEFQNAGIHHSTFSTLHYSLPSGVYFYQLTAGEFQSTMKMILTK